MYYTLSKNNEERSAMPREKKYEKAGRPAIYEGERRPVTIQWPVELLAYIDAVTDNRTKWLIEAAQEKRQREGKEQP